MAWCLMYVDTDSCCQRCKETDWSNKTWCHWVYLLDDKPVTVRGAGVGVGAAAVRAAESSSYSSQTRRCPKCYRGRMSEVQSARHSKVVGASCQIWMCESCGHSIVQRTDGGGTVKDTLDHWV